MELIKWWAQLLGAVLALMTLLSTGRRRGFI
jgi:hypothetical protein